MNQVTEEQLLLCQKYLNMVFSTEEGFEYVKASFTDFSKTEGDLVLSDIFQSLSTITQTNIVVEQLLNDNEEIQQAIKEYTKMIEATLQLDGGQFDHYDKKVEVVNEILYPTFFAWKETIQTALDRYVTQ